MGESGSWREMQQLGHDRLSACACLLARLPARFYRRDTGSAGLSTHRHRKRGATVSDWFAAGRPLDQQERHALELIEQQVRSSDPDFPERLGSRPGMWHPPIRQTGVRLRWPVVVGIMLAASVYAWILYLLPDGPTVLAVVLVQLVFVPAGCLIWAARHHEL